MRWGKKKEKIAREKGGIVKKKGETCPMTDGSCSAMEFFPLMASPSTQKRRAPKEEKEANKKKKELSTEKTGKKKGGI